MLQDPSVHAGVRTEGRQCQTGPLPPLACMRSKAGSRSIMGTWGTPLLVLSSLWGAKELGLEGLACQASPQHLLVCTRARKGCVSLLAGLAGQPVIAKTVGRPGKAELIHPPACARPGPGNEPVRATLCMVGFSVGIWLPLVSMRARVVGGPGWARPQHPSHVCGVDLGVDQYPLLLVKARTGVDRPGQVVTPDESHECRVWGWARL